MKNVKVKLSAIVGAFVLLTLAAVIAAFNFAMDRQIRQDSEIALNRNLSWDFSNWEEYDKYLAQTIILDENYSLSNFSGNYTPQERSVANWCQENRETDVVRYVHLDNRFYYIQIGKGCYMPEDGMFTAAFVDVTGERALIQSINRVFLFIMAIMGGGGCVAGYAVGTQVEKSQALQKKFYENMSHELKTPLAAIQGYAEGLEVGILEDSRQAGRIISGEARKMSRLVEEILCLARLESGVVTLHKESIRVGEFVENCLLPLEGAIKKRDLQVELQVAEGSISADPEQLEHALMNVLTNAIKYADSRITLQYENGNLIVWNDGDHLSDEDISHLFDRFYTGKGGKTGVGLALAKEITELHGWRLQARRMYGGICFCFAMEG